MTWLTAMPGTPASEHGGLAEYLRVLGELYLADDRFAANYGGTEGAVFVRAALGIWIDQNLAE